MTGGLLSPHWREIAAISAVRAYNLITGVVSFVIIARLLGPEGQGTIAAAISWTALVATVTGLSLGHVTQHRIQARRPNAWDGAIFYSLLFLTLLLSLLGAGFAIGMYLFTSGGFFGSLSPSVLILAFALLPLLIWDEYASNLLAAAGRMRIYNLIQILGRSIGLGLLLVLVGVLNGGVQGAIGASVCGQAIIAAGSVRVLWKMHKTPFRIDLSEIRQLARGALRLHLNTIGSFLLASSSVLVLNHLASRAEVGLYNLAWQMIMMLVIVPQAASSVLYSRISEQGPDNSWPVHKRIVTTLMVVMLLLAAGGYVFGPVVIVLLAGESFSPSGRLFQILLPSLLGMSLAQLMAPQWISRGIFLPTSIITIFTAALHVGLTVAFATDYGAIGAAWATALTLSAAPLLVQGYFAWWCEQQFRRSLLRA